VFLLKVFDKDGHGWINTPELQEVMQTIGDVLSSDEAAEFVAEADVDGDGSVNYEEFVNMIFRGSFGASWWERWGVETDP